MRLRHMPCQVGRPRSSNSQYDAPTLLHRYGLACPGHPSRHGAGGNGRDKPCPQAIVPGVGHDVGKRGAGQTGRSALLGVISLVRRSGCPVGRRSTSHEQDDQDDQEDGAKPATDIRAADVEATAAEQQQ